MSEHLPDVFYHRPILKPHNAVPTFEKILFNHQRIVRNSQEGDKNKTPDTFRSSLGILEQVSAVIHEN